MKRILILLTIAVSILCVSCAKKPLTLDENTSMKRLLKANDEEIKELVIKEVTEKQNIEAEQINVEYILRDEESQAMAVKIKIEEE